MQKVEDAIVESMLSIIQAEKYTQYYQFYPCFSEPCSVLECIAKLRAKINFTMPVSDENWFKSNRTEIDVR